MPDRLSVMTLSRALIVGMLLAAGLAVPANAQHRTPNIPRAPEDLDKARDAVAIDKQYKQTIERTKKEAAAPPADPWQNLRASDDAKAKR